MTQFQQKPCQQAVGYEIRHPHQPTPACLADHRREQPLQRTPQPEREKLEQYNHHQKHRAEHKANLSNIKKTNGGFYHIRPFRRGRLKTLSAIINTA